MEISTAHVDVAVERWLAQTSGNAIREDQARTFAQVKVERLGYKADAAG